MLLPDSRILTTENRFISVKDQSRYPVSINYISNDGRVCTGTLDRLPDPIQTKRCFLSIAVYNLNYPNLKPYVYRKPFLYSMKLLCLVGGSQLWLPVSDLQDNMNLVIFDPVSMKISSDRRGMVVKKEPFPEESIVSYSITGPSRGVVLDPYIINKL